MNRAKYIDNYRVSTASNLGAINKQIVVIKGMQFKITKLENKGYNIWIEKDSQFVASQQEKTLADVRKTIAIYKQYA